MAVLHVLRGSEDMPEMTLQQRDTLRWFIDAHDEVDHRVLRDGTVRVETTDYDDSGRTTRVHVLSRTGIPF